MSRFSKNDLLDGNLKALGYSLYNITDNGEITNLRTQKVLKPFVDRFGYENYSLWGDNGKRKTMRAHQLVAKLYVPNPKKLVQVDHKDGNKRNNTATNLQWVTNLENAHNAMKSGLMPHAILDDEKAKLICAQLEQGKKQSQISRDLGVPRSTVASIKLRRNWKHISKDYNF